MLDTTPYSRSGGAIAVAAAAGDEVTRRRLGAALAGGSFELMALTDGPDELVRACIDVPVRALVVALDLSQLAPTGELRLLRAELPDTPIVVVSLSDGRAGVRKALAAGAHGFVGERDIEDVLELTVRAACAGQVCVPHEMHDQVERPAFSIRERQVLELVTRGFTNAEIAQQLFIAESTVKTHLSSGFRKLGVNSRKEAAGVVLDPDNGLGLGLTAIEWMQGPSFAAR